MWFCLVKSSSSPLCRALGRASNSQPRHHFNLGNSCSGFILMYSYVVTSGHCFWSHGTENPSEALQWGHAGLEECLGWRVCVVFSPWERHLCTEGDAHSGERNRVETFPAGCSGQGLGACQQSVFQRRESKSSSSSNVGVS